MARCLPFPPPRFVLNGVSGEALLELIKVRREKAAAEKRRKKEKRRRKKQKKEWEEGEIRENKDKRKKIKKSWDTGECVMNRENEKHLLDRSNLTEEFERPLSDSLYDSSDNTENIKGKEHCWSINDCRKHGSIIRVDLQSQKHKEPQVLSNTPVRSCKQLWHSSYRRTGVVADEKAETASTSTSFVSESCLQHVHSQYRELILNWIPPPIQIEHSEFDNQDWIFERKHLRRNTTEISIGCHDDLHNGRCSLYPGAQYLHQADIYALPYTVLF